MEIYFGLYNMILQRYKIVFGGTIGAGKTSAIKSLSDIPVLSTEALNTDHQTHNKLLTTVGIDYGEVILEDNTIVGLYGTPGQERFNFMWEIICQGALGVIILIDHSNPDRLNHLKYYIDAFKKYGIHMVIGITHLDQDSNLQLKIYRDYMKIYEHHYPLYAVDARIKNDILLLTETLITNIEVN